MSDPNIAFPVLKLFLCVTRTGSLAAAARESGLSPSGVSRQIAALEQELGFRLFDRTTRRLAATEAGALYHERMAPLVRAMDEAAQIAGDRVRAPSGLLKVTASIAFAERWLIPRLPAFRATYPEIDLDLMLDDAPLDLSRAGIDVAFRLTSRVTGDVVVSKLMDTRYRVVASPDYVTRHGTLAGPDDLRHRACISFTIPAYRRRWLFRRGGEDDVLEVPVHSAVTISSALAVRRAALAGLGPALLADWTVDDDITNGRLKDLLPDWHAAAEGFDTAAWVVYPSRNYVPAKARVFIDHIRTQSGVRPTVP